MFWLIVIAAAASVGVTLLGSLLAGLLLDRLVPDDDMNCSD